MGLNYMNACEAAYFTAVDIGTDQRKNIVVTMGPQHQVEIDMQTLK